MDSIHTKLFFLETSLCWCSFCWRAKSDLLLLKYFPQNSHDLHFLCLLFIWFLMDWFFDFLLLKSQISQTNHFFICWTILLNYFFLSRLIRFLQHNFIHLRIIIMKMLTSYMLENFKWCAKNLFLDIALVLSMFAVNVLLHVFPLHATEITNDGGRKVHKRNNLHV